ncbi:MAG: DUF479 domain-containing protein [Akkermansiaceae bacterium]|nr:DUF479 domain-containing protein [Akkermansiaceae bacterium]
MNFLAHLLLAAPTDASRIGNLLGDFVKGPPASLRENLPEEVVHGIIMHRSLDVFTDRHPAFREARGLLSPARRRFAGVIVDVIFDHFLAVHWEEFGEEPLHQFLDDVFAALDRHPDWIAGDLARILPRMKEENWLHSYATLEGLTLTFHRISHRSRRTGPIDGAATDLVDHYHSFDHAFQRFFPDARAEAQRLLAGA